MQKIIQLILGATGLLVTTAYAAPAPFIINAYGIHHGVNVVYRYQIVNNSASVISGVLLGTQDGVVAGRETAMPGLPWEKEPWALDETYENEFTLLPLSQCKPFAGTDCRVAFNPEYYPVSSLFEMLSLERYIEPEPVVLSEVHRIKPNTVSSVAEITVPRAYQSMGYLNATGVLLLFDEKTKNLDGTVMTEAKVPFTKIDTTPPVLTVTLTPATITAAQRGQMIPVTATITVKDDYDPAPEIKLVSVLADDPANGSDIQGDAVDTDDRSFSVRAARFNPAIARTYQVVYSATDASGNTSTATVNLLVN